MTFQIIFVTTQWSNHFTLKTLRVKRPLVFHFYTTERDPIKSSLLTSNLHLRTKSMKKNTTSSNGQFLVVVNTVVRSARNFIGTHLDTRVYKSHRQTGSIISKCENTRIIFIIMLLKILNWATRTRMTNKKWLPHILPQRFEQLVHANWITKTWFRWTARVRWLRYAWQPYFRYWTI